MFSRLLVVLVPLFVLAGAGARYCSAQAVSTQPASEIQNPQSPEETPEAKQRRIILDHVSALGARLANLPDTYYKVIALASFAGGLCKHDADEARRLFYAANDALANWDQDPTRDRIDDSLIATIRGRLVREASACDASLAERFKAVEKPKQPPSPAIQQTAALLSSASHTSELARRAECIRNALQAGGAELWRRPDESFDASFFNDPSDWEARRPVNTLVALLQLVRRQDQAAGDELFLTAVRQLRSIPAADPGNLLVLGYYLFGSPLRGRLDPAADLPEPPPLLAAAYVEAVIDLLLTQAAAGNDKQGVFNAAAGLLPRARKYLPERAIQLASLVEALTPANALATKQAGGIAGPKPPDPEGRAREKEIEALPDEQAKDAAYLRLASDLLWDNQSGRAREVAAKITDPEARAALNRLLDVEDGAEALEQGKIGQAVKIADRMSPSAERATLMAAIAAARVKTSKQLAVDTALVALQEAANITDGRQPYVQLAVAQVLAAADAKLAFEVFRLAVAAFNQEYGLRQADPKRIPMGLATSITVGNAGDSKGPSYSFSTSYGIQIEGFDSFGDLDQVISRLAAIDLDQTETLCLGLADPRTLAQAVPVLAAAWLKKLPAAPPPGK